MSKISFIIEGLGYGHAARMFPIIEKLGGNVITYGQGAEFFKDKKIDVIEVEQPYDLKFGEKGLDITSTLTDALKRFNSETISKAKQGIEDSNLIVVDSSTFGLFLSSMLNKKTIFVSNNTDSSIFFSGVHKVLIKGFEKFFQSSFSNGNILAIPDFPLPYSICAKNLHLTMPKNTVFLGPVVDLSQIRKWKNSTVVISQGAGYNAENSMVDVAKKIKEYNFVVRGKNPKDENIVYMEDLRDFMGGSKANVLHGGHTSIMETIMLRRPIVCVPNSAYPERVNNSLMVKELGLGEYLKQEDVNEYSLGLAIERARRLRKNLEPFHKIGKKMNGTKKLISLIEENS